MYIATCSCHECICTQNYSKFVKFVSLHRGRGHTVVTTEVGCPKPKVVKPKKDPDEKSGR